MRVIEPVFIPEEFSGLNWEKAVKKGLVGREVEFSSTGYKWIFGVLSHIGTAPHSEYRYVNEKTGHCYTYIRTCPETHAHPTITIGGVKLPLPEVGEPERGTLCFYFDPYDTCGFHEIRWFGDEDDVRMLKIGCVHLTESRAKEWADWWQETVIKAMQ